MLIRAALILAALFSGCSAGELAPRAANAISGSEFAKRIAGLPLADREAEVKAQSRAGNVPDTWRKFAKITVTRRIAGGEHTVIYAVAPDYLAIGSDADSLSCR